MSNSELIDMCLNVRFIASANISATDFTSTMSLGFRTRMESVTTTFFRPERSMRCNAPPDSTACVHAA